MTNVDLYGDLPKISHKIRERGIRFAGHCSRSEEPASKMVHWMPKHGRQKPGRPTLTYVDILKDDARLEAADFRIAMENINFEDTTRNKSTFFYLRNSMGSGSKNCTNCNIAIFLLSGIHLITLIILLESSVEFLRCLAYRAIYIVYSWQFSANFSVFSIMHKVPSPDLHHCEK
ncbi:uncharacterized protein [Amphiura filiformis]|uniref:uncharacterized protein n=1 Tax=Amphiura filiformis TaxID=82378 RepID=UPI003B21DEC4